MTPGLLVKRGLRRSKFNEDEAAPVPDTKEDDLSIQVSVQDLKEGSLPISLLISQMHDKFCQSNSSGLPVMKMNLDPNELRGIQKSNKIASAPRYVNSTLSVFTPNYCISVQLFTSKEGILGPFSWV
jgi:hypothetical protein